MLVRRLASELACLHALLLAGVMAQTRHRFRIAQDGQAACPFPLPETGWGPIWNARDFESLDHLCDPFNVGCFCRAGVLLCRPVPDMAELSRAFTTVCKRQCSCPSESPDDKENGSPTDVSSDAQSMESLGRTYYGAREGHTRQPNGAVEGWGANYVGYAQGVRTHRRCPANRGGCFSQQSCGGGAHCRCTARPYPPLDRMNQYAKWSAQCGIPLSPRSEDAGTGVGTVTACPCNCTYVSGACCGAPAGIVQEEPSKKLGVLQPPEGMCCNAETGALQNGTSPGGNSTACFGSL
ncbi:MAG: hypothetical protein M1832_004590 [Thelocarpon impressellum]|nr:MAG: hypothetical protein M1832_004590 [Thelocarpon impressellum]